MSRNRGLWEICFFLILAFACFSTAVNAAEASSALEIRTVKTLVPYADVSKLLTDKGEGFMMVPLDEFERLRKAKQDSLASAAASAAASGSEPAFEAPPMSNRMVSARLEGALEGTFARFEGEFTIEIFGDDWQVIELLRGSLAIQSASLDGKPVSILSEWLGAEPRRIEFGKASHQAQGKIFPGTTFGVEILGQDLWKESRFRIPVLGKGRHVCKISFLAPVEKRNDRFNLDFGLSAIPLTFVRLDVSDNVLSVEETSFRDWTVETREIDNHPGCSFVGWLGAEPSLRLAWRRKARRAVEEVSPITEEPFSASASVSAAASTASSTIASGVAPAVHVVANVVKAPPRPLVYARSETLITLGETALQGRLDIEYSITKASVSSFVILLPNTVEILGVQSDRPQSYQLVRDGDSKRLVVDFLSGREDFCPLTITFEAKMDETLGIYKLPDVHPIGVERELGTLALQALTSVEVQPSTAMEKSPPPNLFRVDATELPDSLKNRATRPILLAYRLSARPSDLEIMVKRYEDLPLQTVVADAMDLKTAFTTNGTSQSQVTLRIRNNNKQYLTMQLSSGTEVLSALRDGKPIKLVAGRGDGRVQVPLVMSQVSGRPEEMELKVLFKNEIASMPLLGEMGFESPLVDIPVSHFTWTFYAPLQYVLFNFLGTVTSGEFFRDPFFFRGFLKLYDWSALVVMNPEAVTFLVFVLFILLLVVAREWLFWALRKSWAAVVWLFTFVFTGKGFRLAELMVVIAVLGILAAMAIPNFRRAREQSRTKACYANQRVLLGAVEMYNMGHTPMMTALDMEALIKGSYLKGEISKPMLECDYKTFGDLSADGFVYCRSCGGLDASVEEIQLRAGIPTKAHASHSQTEPSAPPSETGKPIVGGRAKGVLPLETKFVMTQNFYSVVRDLVLSDQNAEGTLVSNSTCPRVKFRFMRWEIIQGLKITAFILGLLAGFYFIGGTFHSYLPKIVVSGAIILILSIWDQVYSAIGDAANMGLWLALVGGAVWKIGWFISLQNFSTDSGNDDDPAGPRGTSGFGGSGRSGGSGSFGGPGKSANLGQRSPRTNTAGVNFDDRVTKNPLPEKKDSEGPTPRPSGNPDSGPVALGVILFLLLVPLASFGAQTQEIRVMVPFSDLSKVVGPEDKMVIIPETAYRYLLDVDEKPVVKVIRSPMDFTIRQVEYNGTVGERGVKFHARFDLELFNDGWKIIRVLSASVVPSKAALDGIPAPLDLIKGADKEGNFYGLISNATGSRVLEVDFFLPFSATEFNTRRFEFQTIPLCISTLELTVPEGNCDAWIDPGVLSVIASGVQGTTFKAILPPTRKVRLELARRLSAPVASVIEESAESETASAASSHAASAPVILREETRVAVNERNLLVFEEGFVRGRNLYSLQITGTEGISSFTLRVPPQLRILKVEDRVVDDWKVEEKADEKFRRLNVVFTSEVRGQIGFAVDFEDDIQDKKEETYPVPELVPVNVDRSTGLLAIGCLPVLEVAAQEPSTGYSPIDAGEFLRDYKGQAPEKLPYVFKFIKHPNKLQLSVTRPKAVEQSSAVVDEAEAMTLINEDGFLLTRMAFEVRNNSEQFLKIRLPRLNNATATLWSSEVANLAVKAGYDPEREVFNVPIIRSPMVNGESQPFPVEIIFAIRLNSQLRSLQSLRLELPRVHLDVSELSWVVFLPEGFELMRGQGNVDRTMDRPAQPLLEGSKQFPGLDLSALMNTKTQAIRQRENSGTGHVGLLPVKFMIPTTSWSSGFIMQQVGPKGEPPHVEGFLVSPRVGSGLALQLAMILGGALAGFAFIFLFIGRHRFFWFTLLAILSSGLAFTLMMKLYQADNSFKMGFLSTFVTFVLFYLYRWNPSESKPSA